MADSSDYIQLTLPTRLSSEQRQRMIASFTRNLAILNGPDKDAKGRTLAPAKAAAREAIKAIHKQIAGVGGRIDTQSSRYQFDPGTGEIKGIVGPPPKAGEAPPAAKSILTTDSHQIRIPLALNRTPSALFTEKPASKQDILDAFPQPALKPGETRQPEGAAPAMAPGVTDPTTQLRIQSAQKVDEATGADLPTAAAIPQTPTAAPVPDSSKPTVPSDMEDLNADPTLAALAPPPAATQPAPPTAPAETPEMTRLRALLAELEPPPPNFEPSIAQKIGYGLLAGFQGADKVEPLIAGQRAQAAQKYVLARQTREETINNLTKLVSLQDEQAQREAELRIKTADLQAQIGQRASEINQVHADAAPLLTSAATFLYAKPTAPGAEDGGIALSKDLVLQQRAALILGQIDEVQAAQKSLQEAYNQNPRNVSPEQVAFAKSRNDQLTATLDKAMSEKIARLKEAKLPDSTVQQIASLNNSSAALKQAISMVKEGIGGPVEARFLQSTIGATIASVFGAGGRVQQVGILAGLVQQASAERARGIAGRLAEFETEVFPAVFLDPSLPPDVFIGRANAMIAYSEAKARFLNGELGAQTEAERDLATAAGMVVVGHSPHGWPKWISPQGAIHTEAPEGSVQLPNGDIRAPDGTIESYADMR